MITVGVQKNLATNGKMKNVPNYPRKLDENVFWNFYLSSPSVGILNIWLKIGRKSVLKNLARNGKNEKCSKLTKLARKLEENIN